MKFLIVNGDDFVIGIIEFQQRRHCRFYVFFLVQRGHDDADPWPGRLEVPLGPANIGDLAHAPRDPGQAEEPETSQDQPKGPREPVGFETGQEEVKAHCGATPEPILVRTTFLLMGTAGAKRMP